MSSWCGGMDVPWAGFARADRKSQQPDDLGYGIRLFIIIWSFKLIINYLFILDPNRNKCLYWLLNRVLLSGPGVIAHQSNWETKYPSDIQLSTRHSPQPKQNGTRGRRNHMENIGEANNILRLRRERRKGLQRLRHRVGVVAGP